MAATAAKTIQAGRSVVIRHLDELEASDFRTLEAALRLVSESGRAALSSPEGTGSTAPRLVLTFDDESLDEQVHSRIGHAIRVDDLPEQLQRQARSLSPIEALEYDAIVDALRTAGGNRSAAATALGIGRTTLYRKMHAFGLDRENRLRAAQ